MIDVEKQLLAKVVKAASAEVEKAAEAFDTARAAFEAENPGLGISEFCRTEKGRHLYGAQRVAERRRDAGPVEAYTAAIDAAIDKIDTDIEKSIEEFSVAHNLDRVDARTRLRSISPSFAALEKARRTADTERGAAVAKARDDAAAYRYAELAKSRQALADEQLVAARKRMTPAERRLDEVIAKHAADRGCSRPDATAAVLKTELGRELYNLAREEQRKA